jgi:hypothetical protein
MPKIITLFEHKQIDLRQFARNRDRIAMAKIYPERLPESILKDPKRSAERRFYEAASQLSNKFTVFYSVAWQAVDPNAGARDGEADFVIAHPDLGLMVVEVKGGGIGLDSSSGEWRSIDRDGIPHSIKDPIEQARNSKHELFKKLRDLPGWNNRWLTIAHAVSFPDIYWESNIIKPDLSPEIVIDAKALKDLENVIVGAFRYYAGGQSGGLGYDRLEMVERLLARSFQIKTPLGVELAFEDERLIELTERQMIILDFLSNRRRAAIKGCAGSGKTMLALEKARQLADQGFEVLLTCFNYALANYLAQRVPDGVSVLHFHGLCRAMANEAGFPIRPVRDETEFYETIMPDALLGAIDRLGPKFDAIIVDEGQDFKENWWFPLVSLLRDQEQGILFAFYDDNQNLYHGSENVPGVIDEAPFPLIDNCRNTQKIHHIVSTFHHDGRHLRCPGPEGKPPEIVEYADLNSQIRNLRQILHRLVYEEHVDCRDIVVLTPRSQERSDLKDGMSIANFTLSSKPTQIRNHIQVSSVHTFKGLESRVVILTEVDPEASSTLDSVLYVGCSRARTYLVILYDRSLDEGIKLKITGTA